MNDRSDLNGRSIFTWRPGTPGSMAAALAHPDNLEALADAIARSSANLFTRDGRVVWLNPAGELVPVIVNGNARDVLANCVVTKRLVQRDGKWQVDYVPFPFSRGGADPEREPDERALIALVTEKLPARLPKAP